IGVIASVTVVALAAAVAMYVIAVDDPFGGEPTATAKIEDVNGSVGRGEVTVVGVKSGSGEILPPIVRDPLAAGAGDEEIVAVRPPGGGITVTLPNGSVQSLSLPTVPMEALEEEGPHGRLPRIAENGLRPVDAYARPVPGFVGASPKIVVIVGGLGLSQTGTQEALRQLPPEVTLAFAPYGSSLDRWTARARQDGHEILLQVPLEPFDYPDNDPGPHTLISGASPEKNIDSLHWLMTRIGAYVGVMTYMGARFTADPAALEPVMEEIAGRGLMFVDDGASLRSRTAETAVARSAPYARADIVIDSVATADEIAGRLAQLEQIARTRGLAVGVASALPVSVRSIGEWAATLERRGITLVPVSASMAPG
ncbi:MAG TPA: divergent polysaccharide deacetylase family protein, partial [Methylomirabilota bacterium]|nr:divergent polysaccharide deacetylase family protein [Methylomirabilota bacterium]